MNTRTQKRTQKKTQASTRTSTRTNKKPPPNWRGLIMEKTKIYLKTLPAIRTFNVFSTVVVLAVPTKIIWRGNLPSFRTLSKST
jgi:hypothetical protein